MDSSSFEQWYKCPLTKSYFIDPVLASDGYTYERKAIENYFRIDENIKSISPMNGDAFPNHDLYTNVTMQELLKVHQRRLKLIPDKKFRDPNTSIF